MRTLLALLVASTLIGGCGCAEVNYLRVDDEPLEPAATTVADVRLPGGWWFDADADPGQMCGAPTAPAGMEIPCRNVLQLCVFTPRTGEWTNVIMPTVFSCTDESPTIDDLCATRPAVEWDYYGVSREECDEVSDG